jgi:hypothetical protein
MRGRPFAFGLFLLIAATLAALARVRSGEAPAADPAPAARQSLAAPRYSGSLSCAATTCHGSVATPQVAGSIGRNEYIFWLEQDPHARSAESLDSASGLAILERLGISKDGRILDQPGYQNCRACHALDPTKDQRLDTFASHSEGVGCESCHGASEHWRTRHYQRDFDGDDLSAAGMIDTKDLRVRGQQCIACHVGAPDKQVNHDLIAAGHPGLKFELAAYHAMLPKHWRADLEQQQHPTMDLDLWRIGQRQCLLATIALIEDRASNEARTWPELSDFDCFACHHDLEYPSRRQARGFAPRRPGALTVAPWYWPAHLTATADSADNPDDLAAAGSPELLALRQVLERSFPSNRADVAARAATAIAALQQSVPPTMSLDALLQQLDALLIDENGPATTAEWDRSAQLYLCLMAAFRTWRDTTGVSASEAAAVSEQLRQLRTELAFPPGMNSPQTFGPTPASLEGSGQLRATFRGIISSLRRAGDAP